MALLLNAGDTVQRSYSYTKPSPTHISQPEECGDLVTTGEHAGEYAIPITLAGQTQIIYLSEPIGKIGDYADAMSSDGTVTRRIFDAAFTGSESWQLIETSATNRYFNIGLVANGYPVSIASSGKISSHFESNTIFFTNNGAIIRIYDNSGVFATETDFKTYLQQQYANGTPVIVWYVLANPVTESTTAPTITPSAGANTLTCGTTLAPSEVSITGLIKQ